MAAVSSLWKSASQSGAQKPAVLAGFVGTLGHGIFLLRSSLSLTPRRNEGSIGVGFSSLFFIIINQYIGQSSGLNQKSSQFAYAMEPCAG
jgi:hypothetical protein